MENPVLLSWLNDFMFCPVSIYFHNLYSEADTIVYQSAVQINGKAAHSTIDKQTYSKPETITGLSVYSDTYNLTGKIDIYYKKNQKLIERKKKVSKVYDGLIFQLYGQYFAMKEMGYPVKELTIYSMDDNKSYAIPLPEENPELMEKFHKLLFDIKNMDFETFVQTNGRKCRKCIYEPICDRSIEEYVDTT